MARPARTAPLTDLKNAAMYVKANGTSASIFADTMYVGDFTSVNPQGSRSTQSLESSDRIISGVGPKSLQLSGQIVLAPDNANLVIVHDSWKNGTILDVMFLIGAEPTTGAKNYVQYFTGLNAQWNASLNNGVWVADVQLIVFDGDSINSEFNVTAWPSL